MRRPVVRMKICLGGLITETVFNLAERTAFSYRVLLGRTLMAGRYMVRSGKTHMLDGRCAGK